MANIKSQKKRIIQSEKQHQRNKAAKSALKTQVGKVRETIDAKDKDTAQEALKATIKALDKAATKGFIHANKAANEKSALTKAFNKIN